jgi:MYXO-CTERM domain-containing protein
MQIHAPRRIVRAVLRRSYTLALVVGAVACTESAPESTTEQAATVCAAGPTVGGMDVSSYETAIDWDAAHAAGIDFAFIRVSDGTQFPDPMFATYWPAARAAGVIRGAYQYFRPAEDAVAQANLLLTAMGTPQPGDLPPVLDLEVSGGLTVDQVVAQVHLWIDTIAAAIGRPPIVYAGLYSWPTLTGGLDVTTSPLWIAQYTSADCPDIPDPWTQWLFWQYTATGTVDGVDGTADHDLDTFDGTLADLQGFTMGGTCGDGTCSGGETSDSCPVDCPPCGEIGDSFEIDDGDACFVAGGPPAYLRHVTGAGEEGDLIWTHATDAATEANYAQWNLYFTGDASYHIEAYTDHAYATSHEAHYVIHSGTQPDVTVVLDQSAVDGWQPIGDVAFAQGGEQWVHLGDNTGEPSSAEAQLVFDAVRLTQIPTPETMTPPSAPKGFCAAGGGDASGGALLALVGLVIRRRRRTL